MKASLQLEVEALLLVLQDDGADPPEEVGVVVGDPCFSSISALHYAIKCVLLDNNVHFKNVVVIYMGFWAVLIFKLPLFLILLTSKS